MEFSTTGFNWAVPTRVLFGAGKLNSLGDQRMPGKKALLCISNGRSAKANGYLDRTIAELERAGAEYVLFNKIGANPVKAAVEEGARVINEEGCDFVVALGGGSVMDAAKSMAFLAPQDGDDLWTYVYAGTGGKKAPEHPSLPYICITTSAGTGSEVDAVAVVTNPDTYEKVGVWAADLFPLFSIVDPELTLTVPKGFSAYQGFDAMFHSIEGYICNLHNPMAAMIQRQGIELVGKYLPRVIADGSDLEARTAVMFANTMGGYSMDLTSTSSSHAIEHALSAYHENLPHGAGLIMISKAYHSFFIEKHACDQRYIELAQFLGKKDADKPEDFIDALVELQEACGVADLKMSDYGIQESELPTMAANAREKLPGLFRVDPCESTEEDVINILKASYK